MRGLPPEPMLLSFDDEEAGGTAAWHEYVPPGFPLPDRGDWVWGPEGCDENDDPYGHAHYEVVRRGWTFTQPGSANARDGSWAPIVRVHVQRAEPGGGA